MSELEDKIAALEAEKKVSDAKILALETALAAAPKSSAKISTGEKRTAPPVLPTFSVGGKEYRFKIPGFSLDGATAYYAADAVKDKALLATIVEKFPGLIERV